MAYYLNGETYNWTARGKEITFDTPGKSALHILARSLIKEKFLTHQVLEEVPIQVERNKTLYLDFYLPLRKLAIEVNGEQHYKFNSQFHATPGDFLTQRKNDRKKSEWCEINGIELIVFKYDESDLWKQQLGI